MKLIYAVAFGVGAFFAFACGSGEAREPASSPGVVSSVSEGRP